MNKSIIYFAGYPLSLFTALCEVFQGNYSFIIIIIKLLSLHSFIHSLLNFIMQLENAHLGGRADTVQGKAGYGSNNRPKRV